MEVDDLYAGRAQPFHAALEVAALSDDRHAETKLPHKAAAIPAGRQRCDHAEFAIAALPPRITEGVGFAMQRRISVLHAAVVSGPKEFAAFVKNRRADRYAALGQPFAGFGYRHFQHRRVIGTRHGLRLYGVGLNLEQ